MIASTADAQQPNVAGRRFSPEQVRSVAPALEKYTQERLYGDVWKRPGLNRRDRSLITIAALIARGQAPALSYYADQALENGVTPREISETIVHLAYYSGWGNAMAAVGPVSEVFVKRRIGRDQLPHGVPKPLPLDRAAEAQRAKNVGDQFRAVAPGLVEYTTDYLFRDLWLRPDLAPRDRSLVTVAALIASGQGEQIPFHLNRAVDNGLTKPQASEVITHLALLCWLAQRVLGRTGRERRVRRSAKPALIDRATKTRAHPATTDRFWRRSFSRDRPRSE